MSDVAVVAGCGPRIGESVARKFAREGWSVAPFARSADYLEALAADLDGTAGAGLAVPTDLTDPDAVREGFETVRAELGPVDLLVNNAYPTGETENNLLASGEGPLGSTEAALEASLDVWVRGAYRCSAAAVRDMRETGGGTIIFTGGSADVESTGGTAHTPACFAGRGLVRSMARELWPEGIHVASVIVDGSVERPGRRDWADKPEDAWIHPDDVAEAYWYLANQPESAWTLEMDLRPRGGELSFD